MTASEADREADREAAVDLAHALGMDAETFTSGACDVIVRAFASRRIAALASARSGHQAVLAHTRAASEALGLCGGLAKDAGTMTAAHEAVLQRGREAIARLADAAIAGAIEWRAASAEAEA